MKHITLITGGARSGKSEYAQNIAKKYNKKALIATAEPFDIEMKERIARHKQSRDVSFFLIEEPLDLFSAIRSLPREMEVAIIDCITVWLGNCLHKQELGKKAFFDIPTFIESLKVSPCDFIIVTNEVGMGIIPENELSRKYRDMIGTLNHQIADLAQKVILMVSGIPVAIKG